ncbi:MAG TPA: hypothetical protein VG389_19415, partial [Myxococcota bacterium]|nr:hypothetical protein [Myxococcota bacterium]
MQLFRRALASSLPAAAAAAAACALALLGPGCNSCSHNPMGGTEVECQLGSRGGSCILDDCVLIVAPGALDGPTTIDLSVEPPLEPTLASELLGGVECVVAPAGLAFSAAADLRLRYDPADLPPAYSAPEIIGVAEQDGLLVLHGPFLLDEPATTVALSVAGAGRYGLSLSPNGPDAALVLGGEPLVVTDDATFLRNVSSRSIVAAFWDGTHLFVGNGARLLVYDGIPSSPAARPDFILGRPNLVDEPLPPSASNFDGTVSGIWSDGTRLAVTTGNRVLIWLNMPAETYAPADVVLGQPSFGEDAPNEGGISATSLYQPDDVWSDGTRLIVADTLNHRWLLWSEFPVLSGTPADVVIGQPDLDARGKNGGAIPAYQSRGALIDAGKVLLTTTFGGNVVFGLDAVPTTSNPPADFTLGTPLSFPQISTTSFRLPGGLSPFGAAGVAVRDTEGGRVAVWNDLGTAAGTPFDLV